MQLQDAFNKLLEREGAVLSTDYNDPGNWTGGSVGSGTLVGSKYGIAAADHPDVNIANLTPAQAMAIYNDQYWQPIWGDRLPDSIAYLVFDEAVNTGVTAAIKMLQGALGVAQDGVFGSNTWTALENANETKLPALLCAAQLQYYTGLYNWPSEGKGWVLRVVQNLRSL